MKRVTVLLVALALFIPLARVSAQQAAGPAPTGQPAIDRPVDAQGRLRLATSSDDYPVTPGDVYDLRYQQGNTVISSQVMVEGDYSINLGVFGRLNAAEMSFPLLKQTVENVISGGYPRSMPSFSIASLGIFNVLVRGETPDATRVMAWGFTRLSDAIKDLRRPSTSMRNIEIISKTRPTRRCDLFKALRYGDESEDPYLRPGEIIVLHRSERSVEIAGEAFRPGVYELLPGEQLGELVSVYGDGLTSRADATRSRIQRMSGDRPTVEYINLASESARAITVRDGDLVTIPAKTANLSAVVFEGAIIPQSGGAGGAAAAGAAAAGAAAGGAVAAAAREEPGTATPLQYNRIIHPFTEGETLSDALRAVRTSLSPLADLAAAFMVREGNPEPVYIDMRGLVTSSASPSDVPLRTNDRIVIPPFSSYVSVQGAVFAPGNFPFRAGLPTWYYIGLAGGIDPERNTRGTMVVSDAQGKTRRPGEPLHAGDFVFVPSNSFFYNLNRYAPLVSLIATVVGTTITVLAFVQR
jgi:polysaccharide biosynthesis/export protein